MDAVRLSVEISPELHKRLKLFAVQQDTNIRAVTIAALNDYLKDRQPERKEGE